MMFCGLEGLIQVCRHMIYETSFHRGLASFVLMKAGPRMCTLVLGSPLPSAPASLYTWAKSMTKNDARPLLPVPSPEPLSRSLVLWDGALEVASYGYGIADFLPGNPLAILTDHSPHGEKLLILEKE